MFLSRPTAVALGLALCLPLAAQAQAQTLSSLSTDFIVSGGEAVTGNPAGIQDWNECYPASDDHSAPGKILAGDDWVVTSEVSFYDFELVSFAAIAKPVGGGRCEFFDGKVAIWKDGAFIGLIEEGVADRLLIGHIAPVDGTVVEIRSGATEPAITGYIAYDAATEELFVTLKP